MVLLVTFSLFVRQNKPAIFLKNNSYLNNSKVNALVKSFIFTRTMVLFKDTEAEAGSYVVCSRFQSPL